MIPAPGCELDFIETFRVSITSIPINLSCVISSTILLDLKNGKENLLWDRWLLGRKSRAEKNARW